MDRGAWRATVHGVTRESDTNELLNNKTAPKNKDTLPLRNHNAISIPKTTLPALSPSGHRLSLSLLVQSSPN